MMGDIEAGTGESTGVGKRKGEWERGSRTRRGEAEGQGGSRKRGGEREEEKDRSGQEGGKPAARRGRGNVRKEPVSLHTASKTGGCEEPVCTWGTFQQPPSWNLSPLLHGPPNKGGFQPFLLHNSGGVLFALNMKWVVARGCARSSGPYVAAGPSSIIRRDVTEYSKHSVRCPRY